MISDCSMISVIDWGPRKQVVHPSEGGEWEREFVTIAVKNAGVTFAVYDSVYAPRMPIIISAHLPLGILGCEYKPEIVPKSLFGKFLLASRQSFLRRRIVTLKSSLINPAPPQSLSGGLAPKAETATTHGYLTFAYEENPFRIDTTLVQETLDIHAQDIHNSYHAMKWGELVMSLSRLIRVCT